MLDPVRRIVSGRKARYTQDGYDLDLCRLTDRIIIMGFPAVGVASLYRNKRSDILRFLEPYAPRYRIFNLCPLYENSYDAKAFSQGKPDDELRAEEAVLGGPVERYPWPDHHPPPLSLMPIMVEGAKKWYLQDDRNVIVIHCKAGKGRSGTFAISTLLALPGLPSAPTIAPSDDENHDKEEEYQALDPKGVLGKTDEEIKHLTLEDKLQYLLRFHTVRRMSPGAKKYGVSIASQRRFLRYFVRLLQGDDPRPPPSHKPRRIALESVRIFGPGINGVGKVLSGGNRKMAVQVWRYKDSIADDLRAKELALTGADSAGQSATTKHEWDDRGEMMVHVGGFVESESDGPMPAPSTTNKGTVKRAASPPTATSSSAHLSSRNSNASASSGSLPSAIRASPTTSPSSSRSTTPLPPPSESAAQHPSSPPTSASKSRLLVPHTSYLAPASSSNAKSALSARSEADARETVRSEGGIVLDADRELMLKFLVGKTGDRHGKLPVMASLALTWFIPSFEAEPEGLDSARRSNLIIEGKDLDFRKPFAGIDRIEIGWRWLP